MLDCLAVSREPNTDATIRILDLASSSGIPAVPLAKALPAVQVVATDLAPSAVSLIQRHAEAEHALNVTARQADAQDLHAFTNSSFGVVTCTYGLMFMPEHKRALTEAYRVLQPKGLFVATVFGSLDQYQFGWVMLPCKHILVILQSVLHGTVILAQTSVPVLNTDVQQWVDLHF